MNDRENIACQHVLNCIKILKYTPVVPLIQAWVGLFPIDFETYSLACRPIAMMLVHLMAEELNKLMPYRVSEIEQERMKYLTLIHNKGYFFIGG
jgi:hypothetical protein